MTATINPSNWMGPFVLIIFAIALLGMSIDVFRLSLRCRRDGMTWRSEVTIAVCLLIAAVCQVLLLVETLALLQP